MERVVPTIPDDPDTRRQVRLDDFVVPLIASASDSQVSAIRQPLLGRGPPAGSAPGCVPDIPRTGCPRTATSTTSSRPSRPAPIGITAQPLVSVFLARMHPAGTGSSLRMRFWADRAGRSRGRNPVEEPCAGWLAAVGQRPRRNRSSVRRGTIWMPGDDGLLMPTAVPHATAGLEDPCPEPMRWPTGPESSSESQPVSASRMPSRKDSAITCSG